MMNRYGKINNNEIEYAPNPLRFDGKDVFTTDPAVFLSQGYKPIAEEPYPDDGKTYRQITTETETEIVLGWEEYEPDEIDDSELLDRISEVLGNEQS